jgi:hypothetical protein
MSIKLMSAVWAITLPDSEKLVLLALADSANDEGACWPSMSSLMTKCSKSDRTIQAAIKSLVSAGHLSRNERPGKGVLYHVHPGRDFAPEAASPPKGTTPTPEEASDKPSRTIIPQKTSSSSERRARVRPTKPEFLPPDWVPAEAWAGWIEMRRQAGRAPTTRACELAVEELRKFAEQGQPPGEVLDQSTLNQWTGLFQLKDRKHGTTGQYRRSARSDGPFDAYATAHVRDSASG